MILIMAVSTGKFLLWVTCGLTILHVACMVGWYQELFPIDDWLYISFFDLDEEQSIGTWFSTLILLFAGLLSLFEARYPGIGPKRWHLAWWLLGVGFCLLSLDEVAGFHEFVNTIVEDTHWTTFGAVLVIALGAVLLPFTLALPVRTRVLFLVAGVIYVGGAVGVERATIWYEENDQLDTLAYKLWTALEEFMEMVGVTLYIYAVIGHIASERTGENKTITVRVN